MSSSIYDEKIGRFKVLVAYNEHLRMLRNALLTNPTNNTKSTFSAVSENKGTMNSYQNSSGNPTSRADQKPSASTNSNQHATNKNIVNSGIACSTMGLSSSFSLAPVMGPQNHVHR